MSLELVIKTYAKKITEHLRDLYIRSYIRGAKDAYKIIKKQIAYDDLYAGALEYYEENGDWIESHFTESDGRVLRTKLSTSLAEGHSLTQFWKTVKKSGMFSYERAEKIYRTESNRAYNEGALRQYKKEKVKYVDVLLGPNPCPICSDIAAGNPYPINEMLGVFPVHPSCSCAVVAH